MVLISHKTETFCDGTIVCNGEYFPVHRVVLSSCSEYFEEIFERTPCRHPFIVLKDVDIEDFKGLLDFMYKGEVNIPQDRLSFFIKAGETLKIKELAVSDKLNNAEQKKSFSSGGQTCGTRTTVAESSVTGKRRSHHDKSFPSTSNELPPSSESGSVDSQSEDHSSWDGHSPFNSWNDSPEERKRPFISPSHQPPKRSRRLKEKQFRKTVSNDHDFPDADNKNDRVRQGNEYKENSHENLEKFIEGFEETSLSNNEDVAEVKMEDFIVEPVDVLITESAPELKSKPHLDSSGACNSSPVTSETFESTKYIPVNQEVIKTEVEEFISQSPALFVRSTGDSCEGTSYFRDTSDLGKEPSLSSLTGYDSYSSVPKTLESVVNSPNSQEDQDPSSFTSSPMQNQDYLQESEDDDDDDDDMVSRSKKQKPRRPCYYCGVFQTDISKHLLKKHKSEEEIIELQGLPAERRTHRLKLLRIKGISKENFRRRSNGEELIYQRKQQTKDVVECTNCFGIYSRKCFYLHKRHCLSECPENSLEC